MKRLKEKVALITGSASGIGEATARLFTAEGATVVMADIQDERGKRVADEIGVDYLHVDVSKETDVVKAVDYVVEHHGRLDCIFNNAGIAGAVGPLDSVTVEMFDRTIAVNLRGVYLGTKYAARVMRKQGGGSIINTASTAAIRTGYGNHIYSASKAGVLQFTKSVAMELGEQNIRVNCVLPGFIPTPMIALARGVPVEEADSKLPIIEDAFRAAQPIRRSGSVDDIAKAVLWLASDDSSFVNGQALVVDGGVTGGRMWSDYMLAIDGLEKVLGL
ncbi:MAG: glucose 1-dehydrogenase [Candidatus Bathyarchaeota archaeon]|nr:glucose 1-dehydrogenase [Candidatus Bathyarchaeota archaeon]